MLQQAANVETKIERVSGISPVQSVRDQPGRTWFPPPLAPPHKGEGNPRSGLHVAPGQTPPSQLVSFVFDPEGLTPPGAYIADDRVEGMGLETHLRISSYG